MKTLWRNTYTQLLVVVCCTCLRLTESNKGICAIFRFLAYWHTQVTRPWERFWDNENQVFSKLFFFKIFFFIKVLFTKYVSLRGGLGAALRFKLIFMKRKRKKNDETRFITVFSPNFWIFGPKAPSCRKFYNLKIIPSSSQRFLMKKP